MLAALALALIVASLLVWFAKSVLVRTSSNSSEAYSSGSSSGLSLDEQRTYQEQILRKRKQQSVPDQSKQDKSEPTSVMQAPKTDLDPPKDDPYTLEQLKAFDGTDPSKPIYVAIKGAPLLSSPLVQIGLVRTQAPSPGTVFDVTRKADTYGKGKSYNLFAGKDASRALGMSSLKPEDAVSDYSTLSEGDMKTLNDWYDFFSYVYIPSLSTTVIS